MPFVDTVSFRPSWDCFVKYIYETKFLFVCSQFSKIFLNFWFWTDPWAFKLNNFRERKRQNDQLTFFLNKRITLKHSRDANMNIVLEDSTKVTTVVMTAKFFVILSSFSNFRKQLLRHLIMSSKRNIPKKIRECASEPKRKKHKKNPKHENLPKTAGNTTTSLHENMIQKKEWSVFKILKNSKIFFFVWVFYFFCFAPVIQF